MSDSVKRPHRKVQQRNIVPYLCPFCQGIAPVNADAGGKKHTCLFCGKKSIVVIPECPYRERAMQQKPTVCESCKEVTPYGLLFHLQEFCRINRDRENETFSASAILQGRKTAKKGKNQTSFSDNL